MIACAALAMRQAGLQDQDAYQNFGIFFIFINSRVCIS